MPHNIYQTEGIIIDRKNFGEAEKLYIIFTEKFGKINAVGQGVRNLKSKLKYNLEPVSIINLALVATGESWRITDANGAASFKNIKNDKNKFALYAKFAVFLNRMLQGQEKNQALWSQVFADLIFLEEENLTPKELSLLETVFIARALHHLGYINKSDFDFFIEIARIDKTVLAESEKVQRIMVAAINEAFRSSHL